MNYRKKKKRFDQTNFFGEILFHFHFLEFSRFITVTKQIFNAENKLIEIIQVNADSIKKKVKSNTKNI